MTRTNPILTVTYMTEDPVTSEEPASNNADVPTCRYPDRIYIARDFAALMILSGSEEFTTEFEAYYIDIKEFEI